MSQKGQYSPLSLVVTSQLYCTIYDAGATKPDAIGLNTTRLMKKIFGDANGDQAKYRETAECCIKFLVSNQNLYFYQSLSILAV